MGDKSGGPYPALLIIDMVKDNFDDARKLSITPLARETLAPLKALKRAFKQHGWPVVFATDAFRREDFIFTGRMKPHALEGTEGARVIDELASEEADLWLPKPRFSAFFRTSLDPWLKERGVSLCAVAGIATNFCVLTTALDAICCDFRTIILEDCTAAVSREVHQKTLDLYRRTALYPLLRVVSSEEFLLEMKQEGVP